MPSLHALSRFEPVYGLPSEDWQVRRALASDHVRRIHNFALGPEGTNIAQACRRWVRRMNVDHKAETTLCETPEKSVIAARSLVERDTLGVFWTCAVYSREMDIFFGNPDTLPFFTQESMPLDNMQLATRGELVGAIEDGEMPATWRIASHPSPSALLRTQDADIVLVNSNAVAAEECAAGRVEACVTTESARQRVGLTAVHIFGSPTMIFFAGITHEGAKLMHRIHAELETTMPLYSEVAVEQRIVGLSS